VAAPDPTDVRLLALVADVGRVAVHDLAKRMGLDVREVAARLAALAAAGLPLVVGVECDPAALRHALATGALLAGYVHGRPPAPPGPVGPPSGPIPVHGAPRAAMSGPRPTVPSPPAASGPQLGPSPAAASGPQPSLSGPPSATSGAVPSVSGLPAATSGPQPGGGGWRGGPTAPDGAVNPAQTWGPPGSAAWVRRDAQPADQADKQADPLDEPRTVRTTPARRTGAVGDTLHARGLAIKLVEVVDPADFLFTAAGYKLQPGERSVVVHTEVTNRGTAPLTSLADLYLVLLDAEGQPTSKAPVALTSRPPHRIGVKPGETAGGHTVYVLPEATELAAVRWSPSPDDTDHALTWTVRDA
jgi:hypothetical protein